SIRSLAVRILAYIRCDTLEPVDVDDSSRQDTRHDRFSCWYGGQESVQGAIRMKKPPAKRSPRAITSFASEAEEAKWWFDHRREHGKQLLAAVKQARVQILTKDKLLARLAASKKPPAPVVALRIPADDLALARKQAEKKGLPYQTYIKSLLHETLAEREKRPTR